MAIQNRRGPYGKLVKSKLLPGEYAIVLQDDPFCVDGKAVYICFVAGDTKRMATYEDMQELIADATQEIIDNLTEEIHRVIIIANNAIAKANEARDFAIAVGEDLIARREAGEFTGPQGADGVVTTTQGQIAFQIINDDLYIYYHDGDTPPGCYIDDNGCLIMDFGGDA